MPAGFPSVELLAVIPILALLMSLLLPVVQAALAAARWGECADHLRGIALADRLPRTASLFSLAAFMPTIPMWHLFSGWGPAMRWPTLHRQPVEGNQSLGKLKKAVNERNLISE